MNQVTRVATPYSLDAVCLAVVSALTYTLKRKPNKRLAVFVASYLMFETAWVKAMYNNNPGNVRPWTKNNETQSYFTFDNPKAPGKYRAFSTLEEGMQTYVYEIARRRELTQAGIDGDFDAWGEAIVDSRYCPDCNPDNVAATMRSITAKLENNPAFASLPTERFTWTGGATFPKGPAAAQDPSSSLPPSEPFTWPVVVLKVGSRGGYVYGIQRMLGIKEDGIFGPKTEAAVKAFQKLCAEPETGIVKLGVLP